MIFFSVNRVAIENLLHPKLTKILLTVASNETKIYVRPLITAPRQERPWTDKSIHVYRNDPVSKRSGTEISRSRKELWSKDDNGPK